MLKHLIVSLAFVGAVAASERAFAQPPAQPNQTNQAVVMTPVKNDYADVRNWLCRPGNTARPTGPGAMDGKDACDIDLTTTVVAADGKLTRETFKADPNAPIDCFYVYPTVSTDRTTYSDMAVDPAEMNVIRQQFARFSSKCRVYAPVYRQVTIGALTRGLSSGNRVPMDSGLGYDDVKDAWNYYLQNDNKGRGFVLVSHSQGSFALIELIKKEIDGKPIQSRMLSAILMGTTVSVPQGKDVGGDFQKIPLCKSGSQLGCVITFASFRSDVPPPGNTLFGKVTEPGMVAACTNPAALAGGSGELHSYLSTNGQTITGVTAPKPWVTPDKAIDTPWVSTPGLLTAKCASNENASGYLEVTVHGNPADPRTDDIIGDLGTRERPSANWGLHLVDANITMGNLLDIVGQETKAYLSKK
jgi:hypothetical protein